MARDAYRHLYKTARWCKLRQMHLARFPLCVFCLQSDRINDGSLTASGVRQENKRQRHLVVDHKVPHRGDPKLFWNASNLQTLCPEHHNKHKQRLEVRGYSEERGADGWPVDLNHPANRE